LGVEVELGFEAAEGAPEGAEVEAARSLTRWLLMEPELRGVEVRPGAADPGAGQMGEVLDVLNVVLSNGIALGSLVTAIAAWRDSRRGGTRVRIERGGTSVVIEGGSAEEVLRIVARLEPPAGGTEHS
jgi:Effector Associated Constant Component 1